MDHMSSARGDYFPQSGRSVYRPGFETENLTDDDQYEEYRHRREKAANVNVGSSERLISGMIGGFLAVYGLRHRSPLSIALSLVGGALVYRGATGHCHVYDALGMDTARDDEAAIRHALHNGVHVERTITIDRPVEEVFTAWRNLENLPRFMNHLRDVHQFDEIRSHWKAKAPAGMKVEWDAEIIQEAENEIISWRSLPGSDIDCAGVVRFNRTDENGTELHVKLRYSPPAGKLGAAVARAFGEEPGQQMTDDLRRFKHMMEFGEFNSARTDYSAEPQVHPESSVSD